MGTKQAFKTYTRNSRILDTNVSFAKGMCFTDAPLVEGFSRLLVNFDFGGEGDTLKPRKGFQTIPGELYINSGLKYSEVSSSFDGMTIVAADRVVHDGVPYYQIIIGRTHTKAGNEGDSNYRPNTYLGDAWVLTVYRDADGTNSIQYSELNDGLFSKCLFTKPDGASIHNITLSSSNFIKRHIGTFAFNGSYYYFTDDRRLHHTYFDPESKKYKVATINPYTPTQAETQNSLYNLLLDDPYTFDCTQIPGVLRLTGFAPHKKVKDGASADERTGELVLSPQNGIEYNYKLYYTYPDTETKYCFHLEYTTGVNDNWLPIPRDETTVYTPSADPFIFENIRVDSPFAQFRIYAIASDKASFTSSKQLDLTSLANSVLLTAAFNYIGTSKTSSTTNLNLVKYDLSYSKGMTYWKNRLWVFGAATKYTSTKPDGQEYTVVKSDNTVLFASEPNRPDWFGYTADTDIFDEEIIHLQPMLDELLVFTAHNLYSITLDAEGLSWTKRHLQANLNITTWDLHLIKTVKNMVFFKSGNYYYMVVPKLTAASGAGLAIAPISKNISGFLDNFEYNTKQLIDDLFNYSCENRFSSDSKVTYSLKLIHYYNNLDYEDVHNNYVFEVTRLEKVSTDRAFNPIVEKNSIYLTFSLLYNTVTRSWRIYTLESQHILFPLVSNATGKSTYTAIAVNASDRANDISEYVGIQKLHYDSTSNIDMYIKDGFSINSDGIVPTVATYFKNWQYFDSGNLDQDTELKKRFREYQFKLINNSNSFIEFYSGFYLDKQVRTYEMQYYQTEIVDEFSGTSTLVVEGTPIKSLQGNPIDRFDKPVADEILYKYTKLGSWKLGASNFPAANDWKVRIPTSGKGYLPRVILISYNQTDYELLSCATVYRQLYSR